MSDVSAQAKQLTAGSRQNAEWERHHSTPAHRTIGHGLRTGHKTGQRNTVITPEMQAAQWKPGQSGNPSGRPHKTPFTAALLRIVERKLANDPEGRMLLDGIAQQLVAKASKGDLASIRELADRIEGKPQQQVTLGGERGGAIQFVNVSPAENERRIAELLAKAGGVGDSDSAD